MWMENSKKAQAMRLLTLWMYHDDNRSGKSFVCQEFEYVFMPTAMLRSTSVCSISAVSNVQTMATHP